MSASRLLNRPLKKPHPHPLVVCATWFVRQGNLTTAVAYYREAIRLCPEFADAHSNLGNVLKVKREEREVEEDELKDREVEGE